MSGATYYERNRDVILNRAIDYYENNNLENSIWELRFTNC